MAEPDRGHLVGLIKLFKGCGPGKLNRIHMRLVESLKNLPPISEQNNSKLRSMWEDLDGAGPYPDLSNPQVFGASEPGDYTATNQITWISLLSIMIWFIMNQLEEYIDESESYDAFGNYIPVEPPKNRPSKNRPPKNRPPKNLFSENLFSENLFSENQTPKNPRVAIRPPSLLANWPSMKIANTHRETHELVGGEVGENFRGSVAPTEFGRGIKYKGDFILLPIIGRNYGMNSDNAGALCKLYSDLYAWRIHQGIYLKNLNMDDKKDMKDIFPQICLLSGKPGYCYASSISTYSSRETMTHIINSLKILNVGVIQPSQEQIYIRLNTAEPLIVTADIYRDGNAIPHAHIAIVRRGSFIYLIDTNAMIQHFMPLIPSNASDASDDTSYRELNMTEGIFVIFSSSVALAQFISIVYPGNIIYTTWGNVEPVPPSDSPVPPSDSPVPPSDSPVPLSDSPVPPSDSPVLPSDSPVPPSDSPVPPPPAQGDLSDRYPNVLRIKGTPVSTAREKFVLQALYPQSTKVIREICPVLFAIYVVFPGNKSENNWDSLNMGTADVPKQFHSPISQLRVNLQDQYDVNIVIENMRRLIKRDTPPKVIRPLNIVKGYDWLDSLKLYDKFMILFSTDPKTKQAKHGVIVKRSTYIYLIDASPKLKDIEPAVNHEDYGIFVAFKTMKDTREFMEKYYSSKRIIMAALVNIN